MKVSAVLPVFNAQSTLERAIKSLLIQPEVDQIILVNDGSSDGCQEICRRFAQEYDHVEVYSHQNGDNLGAPASRNLGLRYVKNAWVQFMDADDELLPGKIYSQLQLLKGDEALVIGNFTMHHADRTELIFPLKDLWSGLISTRLGISVSNLWNAEWIRKAGGWDESLPNMQEYHLMFEIMKLNGRTVFSEGIFTNIYSQPNSITNSPNNLDVKRNNYFLFRQKVKDYLISIGEFNFKRRHYYEVCTGKMLRYHQPPFPVDSNKVYFSVYNSLKKILSL